LRLTVFLAACSGCRHPKTSKTTPTPSSRWRVCPHARISCGTAPFGLKHDQRLARTAHRAVRHEQAHVLGCVTASGRSRLNGDYVVSIELITLERSFATTSSQRQGRVG
jgi:hypothetical protein